MTKINNYHLIHEKKERKRVLSLRVWALLKRRDLSKKLESVISEM